MAKIKPRKLPRVRWTMPPDPSEYRPQPPPDMRDFPEGGLCIAIDPDKFCAFLRDLEEERPEAAATATQPPQKLTEQQTTKGKS